MSELLLEFDLPLNPWTGDQANEGSREFGFITLDIPHPDAMQIEYLIARPDAPIWTDLNLVIHINGYNGSCRWSVFNEAHEAAKAYVWAPDFESVTLLSSGCYITYRIQNPNPPCGLLNIKVYGTNLDTLLGALNG